MATNTENGHRYVGLTSVGIARRRAHHIQTAFNDKQVGCKKFHAAIRKYGEAAFLWSILSTAPDKDDAIAEEMRLIEALNPEYNLTRGGEGVWGLVMSAASRQKMAEAKIGKKQSAALIARRIAPLIGRKQPKDAILRGADKRRGRKLSADHKAKLSQAKIGKLPSNCRAIVCLSDGRHFPSSGLAAKYYGIPSGDKVAAVCRGIYKSSRGHRFQYAEAA